MGGTAGANVQDKTGALRTGGGNRARKQQKGYQGVTRRGGVAGEPGRRWGVWQRQTRKEGELSRRGDRAPRTPSKALGFGNLEVTGGKGVGTPPITSSQRVLGSVVFGAAQARLTVETDPNFERCLSPEMSLFGGGVGWGRASGPWWP